MEIIQDLSPLFFVVIFAGCLLPLFGHIMDRAFGTHWGPTILRMEIRLVRRACALLFTLPGKLLVAIGKAIHG